MGTTRTGKIWAQWLGSLQKTDGVSTVEVRPNNRHITAEAAIAHHVTVKRVHGALAGIAQIVSNGLSETFDPPLPRIQRENVTQITFLIAAHNCYVGARLVINYWE